MLSGVALGFTAECTPIHFAAMFRLTDHDGRTPLADVLAYGETDKIARRLNVQPRVVAVFVDLCWRSGSPS